MITKNELVSGQKKTFIKMLVNGGFGVGKTYFAMTFPKWAYAMIEPHGIQTALTNKELLENMICYEEFVPTIQEDIKDTFNRLTNFCRLTREKAVKGEVETFILDNLSHYTEYRWMHIEKYSVQYTQKGAVDVQRMYGTLTREVNKFIITEVLTLPCHVVVPCHIMDETEEEDGKQKKTGRIITDTLGGFRKSAGGLFNASIFIELERIGPNQYKRKARCLPSSTKDAKNNLGLPEIVENLSYQSILQNLNNGKKPA